MNRTILIVICDFLLVSLVAFSTLDINKISDPNGQPRSVVNMLDPTTNQPGASPNQDLAQVMKVALDEERRNRDMLLAELGRTRETVTQEQAKLGQRERDLQAVRQQLQTTESQAQKLQQDLQKTEADAQRLRADLTAKEQQAARLQQDIRVREEQATRMQQEQASLQQQFVSAQSNLLTMSHQLRASATDALISKERLAAMEAEVKRQAEEAATLQKQLVQLNESNQVAQVEKQRLTAQLQVAEVEKRHATEQVVKMEEQVKIERVEKAKLAEGVKALATRSTQLEQEIRDNRSLAPNTIFNEFVANRLKIQLTAYRTGFLGGENARRKEVDSILVSVGTNTYAVCHVDDTPLTLWNPGTDWAGITGSLLGRNIVALPVRQLSFHQSDPRLVFLPLTPDQVRQLGSRPYALTTDPFKFQDAVLIGTRESYYGECRFQIDVSAQDYVQLDRNVVRGLFGKFNPSRGDLVFSRNGELLGIMANNNYCLKISAMDTAASFQLGQDLPPQNTGHILSLLYGRVAALPNKLQ